MKIRLIDQVSQLDGTQYFEFLPGPYKGRCFTDDSVFIEEDVFNIIEPIFEEILPQFEHYAFNKVTKEDWLKIVAELERQRKTIADASETNVDLTTMLDQFTNWIKATLADHDEIAILGI